MSTLSSSSRGSSNSGSGSVSDPAKIGNPGSVSAVVLGRSSLHGLGAFASRPLERGDVVEVCPCLWVARAALVDSDPSQPSAAVVPLPSDSCGPCAGTTAAASGAQRCVHLLDYLFHPGKGRGAAAAKGGGDDERPAFLLLPLGCGLAYNHGEGRSANVSFEVRPIVPEIVFRATQAVRAGDELLIDYGAEWWSHRGWQPLQGDSLAALRQRLGMAGRIGAGAGAAGRPGRGRGRSREGGRT